MGSRCPCREAPAGPVASLLLDLPRVSPSSCMSHRCLWFLQATGLWASAPSMSLQSCRPSRSGLCPRGLACLAFLRPLGTVVQGEGGRVGLGPRSCVPAHLPGTLLRQAHAQRGPGGAAHSLSSARGRWPAAGPFSPGWVLAAGPGGRWASGEMEPRPIASPPGPGGDLCFMTPRAGPLVVPRTARDGRVQLCRPSVVRLGCSPEPVSSCLAPAPPGHAQLQRPADSAPLQSGLSGPGPDLTPRPSTAVATEAQGVTQGLLGAQAPSLSTPQSRGARHRGPCHPGPRHPWPASQAPLPRPQPPRAAPLLPLTIPPVPPVPSCGRAAASPSAGSTPAPALLGMAY